MSHHMEYRNGALVDVDDKTGEIISRTAYILGQDPLAQPGLTKDVDVALSGSANGVTRAPKPVETGYKPTNCSEMIATRELLQYYSDLMYSCQTDYCKIKYQKICAVLEARLEDMEQRLLYEAKD